MRLFSTKRAQAAQKHRASKKILIMTGIMMTLFMAAPITNNNIVNRMTGTIEAQAAEQTQTSNWFQEDGNWKVRDGNGSLVTNAWFCDLDGSWYLLDEQGCMREGIISDRGHYYSLETSHQGHYGRMRTVNGVYDGVYLSFNQEHTGTYGEILSGTQELINTGVKVTEVSGLPAQTVYAKDFIGMSSDNTEQQKDNNTQKQEPSNSTSNRRRVRKSIGADGGGYTPGDESNWFAG